MSRGLLKVGSNGRQRFLHGRLMRRNRVSPTKRTREVASETGERKHCDCARGTDNYSVYTGRTDKLMGDGRLARVRIRRTRTSDGRQWDRSQQDRPATALSANQADRSPERLPGATLPGHSRRKLSYFRRPTDSPGKNSFPEKEPVLTRKSPSGRSPQRNTCGRPGVSYRIASRPETDGGKCSSGFLREFGLSPDYRENR